MEILQTQYYTCLDKFYTKRMIGVLHVEDERVISYKTIKHVYTESV